MSLFQKTSPYLSQKRKNHIKLHVIKDEDIAAWLEQQSKDVREAAAENGFDKKEALMCFARTSKGDINTIYARMPKKPNFYDMARVVGKIGELFSSSFLKQASFEISGLRGRDLENACISWGLAAYRFDTYKKKDGQEHAKLVLPSSVDTKRIEAMVDSISFLRNLINIPANDMGPDEMEAAAAHIAERHKAKISVVKGAKLVKDFPLVHTVGMASPRAPRLIEITHGKATDPKLVIVGKGVVFDTGGLDIKPSQYMRLMKKDMGGAAHALALGQMIMALKIPVHLRIIIPCVENAVGGASFRPGDIIVSRKGLSVENTNTDAEGRLILADALTYGTETKPDLIIDFATLTGSARAALGPDVPAMFSNHDKLAAQLQKIAMEIDDPLWAMPLWEPYTKTIESPIADLINSAGTPGDLIYSALFLQKFLVSDKKGAPDWVHLDVYAWENNGKPGRAQGGTEMGLRACLALIESRYA